MTDAQVVDAVRDIAWTTTVDSGVVVVRKLSPEGLYGRRKMTAYLRRATVPDASAGSVDRAMRTLGLCGVRRDKGIRTTSPAKDGTRAGDLLDRDFTADAPNRTWVTDFTYCSTWSGWCYTAFVIDAYARRIVAWHAATTKQTDLVMIPLRMALWQRDREGHPITAGQLICHADAGSQYTSIRSTEHLALEEIRPSIGSVGDAYDNALMESINGLYKAECIRTTVFHNGPYKTSPTSSTPPPAGSTGTTTEGSTRPWATYHQSSTSKPTMLLSTESRNPHRNGREPGALHMQHR